MPEQKEILESLNKTFHDFKEQNDKALKEARETREASQETQNVVDRLNKLITEQQIQIDAMKKDSLTRNLPGGHAGDAEATLKQTHMRAFIKFARHGFTQTGQMTPDEIRSLTGTDDTEGGSLVPSDFDATVRMKAFEQGAIRQRANVGQTSRDQVQSGSLSKPIVAWGVTGVPLTAMAQSSGSSIIRIRTLSALAKIHVDLLDDSEANIQAEMASGFSRAIAEEEDAAFAVGDGATAPEGVMTNATVLANVTNTGVAAALSDATNNGIDPTLTMVGALNSSYHARAAFGMNRATEAEFRKLVDGVGRYLWQPNPQVGSPSQLHGFPVIYPQGMANVGANTYPVVFGDFSAGYEIRDRLGMTAQRLNELYIEEGMIGFIIRMRVGGNVVLPEAFRVLKVAV